MKPREHYLLTTGKIVSIRSDHPGWPLIVMAEYVVHGKRYITRDILQYRNEKVKFLCFTRGIRRVPAIRHAWEGGQVVIAFDPDDPDKCYIPENRYRC